MVFQVALWHILPFPWNIFRSDNFFAIGVCDKMNILVDFVLNKKLQRKKKKTITREKHPGRVAQGHKLTAFMKKRKEEILRKK